MERVTSMQKQSRQSQKRVQPQISQGTDEIMRYDVFENKKNVIPSIIPQTSCLLVFQFFKLRGEDCSKRCYYISLKSMKSLSEKGNYSHIHRHTSGKLVPYLLLKVKLAGAGSKLLLTNSSHRKQSAPCPNSHSWNWAQRVDGMTAKQSWQ